MNQWEAKPACSKQSVFGNYSATPEHAPAPAAPGPAVEAKPASAGSAPASPVLPPGLQSAIDAAMARCFLYRFLAQGFADPTPRGWWWFVAPETRRGLWAAVRELNHPPLESAARTFEHALSSESFESFRDEYDAAFGHAARGSCPLNEIEYGDLKADPLFQPHRLADLAAFYRAFGLEVDDQAGERQDHLGFELEFMSTLAAKETYALEHQLEEDQRTLCHEGQRQFLREHLGRWSPAFSRRLSAQVGEGALGALAGLLRVFVEADCARCGVNSGSEDLLLRPVDDSIERLCDSCGLRDLPPGALRTGANA